MSGCQPRLGGRPSRSRPAGLPGEGQTGVRPALPCRGAVSPAAEQTMPGTAARSDGPVPEPVPSPSPGGAGSRQPRVGPPPPGAPTRGTGRMRRGTDPSPTLLLATTCGMGLRGVSSAGVKREDKEQ